MRALQLLVFKGMYTERTYLDSLLSVSPRYTPLLTKSKRNG
jgi:hypothetical protein